MAAKRTSPGSEAWLTVEGAASTLTLDTSSFIGRHQDNDVRVPDDRAPLSRSDRRTRTVFRDHTDLSGRGGAAASAASERGPS
jgi:hypothetical protein